MQIFQYRHILAIRSIDIVPAKYRIHVKTRDQQLLAFRVRWHSMAAGIPQPIRKRLNVEILAAPTSSSSSKHNAAQRDVWNFK